LPEEAAGTLTGETTTTENDDLSRQRKAKRVRLVTTTIDRTLRGQPLSRGIGAAQLRHRILGGNLQDITSAASVNSGGGGGQEDNIAEESSDVVTRTRFQSPTAAVGGGGIGGRPTTRLKQRMSLSSSLVSSSTEQSAVVVRPDANLSSSSSLSPSSSLTSASLSRLRRPSRTALTNLTATAFSDGALINKGKNRIVTE
jgi:hypothetical protein